MTSLQESLNKFKKQQEKCQSTLTSIAAKNLKGSTTQKSVPVNAPARTISPAVKFSNDMERLQRINSIRKAPVGAQIKRVIDLLQEVTNLTPSCFIHLGYCFIFAVIDLLSSNNRRLSLFVWIRLEFLYEL